mmetsp:Transcript_4896/g.11680  ORF Transcript_4896/g.11680 Transcript_4896/m.11680 type:complete len:333 (+) Transcript_4896:1313-2311(+)
MQILPSPFFCLASCISLRLFTKIFRRSPTLLLFVCSFIISFLEVLLFLSLDEDFVDNSESQRLIRRHERVTIHNGFDFLKNLCRIGDDWYLATAARSVIAVGLLLLHSVLSPLGGMIYVQIVETGPHPQQFLCPDLNVRGHSLSSPAGLVEHDGGIRKGGSAALGTAGQEQGSHRCRLSHGDRVDVGADIAHGVVHGHSRCDGSPRAVNVHVEGAIGVLGLQKQELCRHHGGHLVGDLTVNTDDPFAEQPRVDIEGALAGRPALQNDGDGVRPRLLLAVFSLSSWHCVISDPTKYRGSTNRSNYRTSLDCWRRKRWREECVAVTSSSKQHCV